LMEEIHYYDYNSQIGNIRWLTVSAAILWVLVAYKLQKKYDVFDTLF
jgi:hypothetical protein